MFNRRKVKALFFLSVFFILLFPKDSYAYLDPGSGSYLLQMIVAGVVMASVAIKSCWRVLKAFFGNLFSKGPEGGQNPPKS